VKGLRFGLSAIKNVGVSAVENIIKTRREVGNFRSVFDFTSRVDLRLVNKKTLESLIQAGAFDSLGGHRAQMFESVERAIQFGQSVQGHQSRGQSTLFEASPVEGLVEHFPSLPEAERWNEAEKLSREKKVLGFYVSGHPLSKYELEVDAFATARFGGAAAIKNGHPVRVCGIISSVKKKIDKRGNAMAFVTLEDFTGKGECIVFSKTYEKFYHTLQPEAMVMVMGKADVNGDTLKVLADEIYPMDSVRQKFTRSIVLSVNVNEVQDNTIVALRDIIEKHRGNCHCYFDVVEPTKEKASRLHTMKFGVNASDEFLAEVKKLLGPNAVRISQNA